MTKHDSLTDLHLVDLLKEDDEAAFTEIYSRYAARLASFASSRLYDLEEARDIIHDVFVKFWEQRKLLKIDRNLEAYLFTLVRYRVVIRSGKISLVKPTQSWQLLYKQHLQMRLNNR